MHQSDPFSDLTWADLRAWAGDGVVERGCGYRDNVKELARTRAGGLVAWVLGTHRYATWVGFDDGELDAACTCPYGARCKHAVAVVLAYLDALKKGRTVTEARQDDPRLQILAGEAVETGSVSGTSAPRADEAWAGRSQSMHAFLEARSKQELIELIESLADSLPDVRDALARRRDLVAGDAEGLVAAARRAIAEISAEPAWSNHWDDHGSLPDYSPVREQLEALLGAGYADEVLALGEELLRAGTEQIGQSHDEGETAQEIAECMAIVFSALPKSSLNPADRILWAVDAQLADEFDLCNDLGAFWDGEFSPEAWSTAADALLKRLSPATSGTAQSDWAASYRRDRLSDWAITALEAAGREAEIIPLCQQEAEKTGSYVRLVKRLIAANRYEEAEEWIRRGVQVTGERLPGIAAELREHLHDLRERSGDLLGVAALRADAFFAAPGLQTYRALNRAAEAAGVKTAVKAAAMRYLVTGERPDRVGAKTNWPLPQSPLERPESTSSNDFPATRVLIEIAIDEARPDEVLHWYDEWHRRRSWATDDLDQRVAQAVADSHPERAIAIWKRLAEACIERKSPSAYREAVHHLHEAGRVFEHLGHRDEWRDYLTGLKRTHARKRRLLEELEVLDGRRIVDM